MSNPMTYTESIEYIQKKIKDILSKVTQEEIDKVKDLFFNSNRIFVYGAGRSGLVAKAFAIRLVHLGFQTFVIGETITAPVQNGDLVVIVSGSGETIISLNPATENPIASFPKGTEDDAKAAIDAAEKAYEKWSLVPPPKRAGILLNAA